MRLVDRDHFYRAGKRPGGNRKEFAGRECKLTRRDMNPFSGNPFTVLTLIAAPAVLTNASSVLALGTSNRFARAVDRARALAALLENKEASDDALDMMRLRQIERLEKRILLLVHALGIFYASLGAFAAASLVSLIGASLASTAHHILFKIALGIAVVAGVIGVGGLVVGCSILVRETRLAVVNLMEEAEFVRNRYGKFINLPGKPDGK